MEHSELTPRIWIDVEDLFEYAHNNTRPSGIQRLAFEIYAALHREHGSGGRIGFLRHRQPGNTLHEVAWSEIEAVFTALAHQPPPVPVPEAPWRASLHRTVHHLPRSLQDVLRAHRDVLLAWTVLVRAIGTRIRLAGRHPTTPEPSRQQRLPAADGFAARSGPGDVLLVLGSPWFQPDYAGLVAAQRARGLRFAILVYDLIPIVHPEWCDKPLVHAFRAWFEAVLPLCDTVLAISKATAADVTAYAARAGIAIPRPVIPIPIGTGFAAPPPAGKPHPGPEPLPPPGTFVLVVSTIEARKNHLIVFRTWRRLLQDLPPGAVPTLVFAGRIGWLVDDLMRQIDNTDNLDGKLRIIQAPSDADLLQLYRSCLFTIVPSFYEGWGLPVTESLALGKPCIIADRTSLPEAGAGLCRSFDPDNAGDAYAVIRATIEDPAGLAAWQADIQARFKPVPWSVTATALLETLAPP